MIYLDAAATTPVRPEVLEALWPYFSDRFGNASSQHELGHSAARALRQARESIAETLGARSSEIVFTSGGTESDNLAVKGIALANPRGKEIIVSAIEHEAVLESCDFLKRQHGFTVTFLGVDSTGRVNPDELAERISAKTALCSVMYANNEIGTVQPISECAAIARAHAVPFHTDAVQAVGWLDLAVDALGVDALTISGHKIGAPAGIGVLYRRSRLRLEPVLHGGGQERGIRSGTENVAGAVGVALAIRLAENDRFVAASAVTARRDRFIAQVLSLVPSAVLTGHPEQRLPGNASFCFPGTSGEAVLLELERRDIFCSSGSACAAGSDEASHVLLATGLSAEVAQTAVRFTFGAHITEEQLTQAAHAVDASVKAVRGLAS